MPERSNGLGLGPSGLVPSEVRILLPAYSFQNKGEEIDSHLTNSVEL